MENEIINWLNGPRDYTTGRAIFEKYSRKKNLVNLFRRKYKPDVLLYNMQKLVRFKVTTIPTFKKTEEISGPKPDGRKTIVTDRIDYEQLPVRLQKLYNRNREMYKHMRSYHEKMKQAKSDNERANYRKVVIDYDDAISANWKEIDSWDGKEEEEEKKEGTKNEIGAARKYLSMAVPNLEKRYGLKQQKLLFDIMERVEFLKDNNVKIPGKTVTELEKFGVHI